MKAFKIVGTSIFIVFVCVYLAFLFVLPNFIDLDKYSTLITDTIQKSTGGHVVTSGVKFKTTWNLDIGLYVDRIDLMDLRNKKFAQIDDLNTKISLLSLIFKQVKIDELSAQKVLINLETDKNGEFLLCRDELPSQTQKTDFKLSDIMPKISVKKYRISILNKGNNYTLKGQDLKITDFVLNKKITVKALGDLVLNGRKQIDYDVAVSSKLSSQGQNPSGNLIKTFEDLYQYDIKAKVLADLKLDEKGSFGKVDIDKLTFVFGGKTYPPSAVKLAFKDDNVRINASLHVDKKSKAIVTGILKTGKHKFIDLDVKSDEVQIEDILHIASAVSKTFGLKLKDIDAKGIAKAQFCLRSDFKTVKSDGYLKIKNASLSDKQYKVLVNNITADIDFSKDSIKIKMATAKLNSEPIKIVGSIDKNAIANISVLADNLPLKSVLLSFGQANILKENNILSGLVSVNANLNGKLNKASPKINATVKNASLKNIKSKARITLPNALVNVQNKVINTQVSGLKIYLANGNQLLIPSGKTAINNDKMSISGTNLYINGIKTNVSGQITGLNSDPVFNSLTLSIPNNLSMAIKGYPQSKMVVSGNLVLSGVLSNPKITGKIKVPLISLPTNYTVLKDVDLDFADAIKLTCPYIKLADSEFSFSSNIDKDFSKGISMSNAKFNAALVDLNLIGPILKSFSGNSGMPVSIKNGKTSVGEFRVGTIKASNIKSDLALNNNILYLSNLYADAYGGKVAGDITYNISKKHLDLDIQGRGLSSNAAVAGLVGHSEDINGVLDFDGDISMTGYSKNEILKSLKGNLGFIISNGQMGLLGKFEHLIYAQNVLSNSIFKASLNVVAKAISVKDTGVYRYMKGKISFSNGWADINWLKTSGPSMSLYITGRYFLLDDTANLTMLGRISDDVVNILGPIGQFSMDKAISSIPKVGEISAFFANQYTSNPVYENVSQIPNLTPKTEFGTKTFKVLIDGNSGKQSSVKTFKWLSTPKIVQPEIEQTPPPKTYAVPDFVKKLPNY